MEIKKTPLNNEHLKLGAKMVPFAGWKMPVQYSGIIDEHKCVRENVGIFDVSHMGEVFVSGNDSLAFLQSIVPQDISKLVEGKAVYCQMTNEHGGIIDDLIIYKLDNSSDFLLIINASRINEDISWLELNKNKGNFDIVVNNQSDNFSLLAVQGPKSADLINDMGLEYKDQPAYFSIMEYNFDSIKTHVSRTGYTGEDGFEILVSNNDVVELWNKIIEAGQKYDLKPIGLGARDTLRLEAALHLYGQDMDETTTPIEASLGWSIPKDKQENYNGKEKILSQLNSIKPKKVLMGFKMLDKAIPRHGYDIYKDEEKIGEVTSGGVSPILQANIGLGYIKTDCCLKIGSQIDIMVRNKLYKAEIVKRPFVPKSHPKLTDLQKSKC